jgi:two-component system phosphate regulon response regulator OmpR
LGPFAIDFQQRVVLMHGQRVDLTRSEFDIFARLAAQPGVVFTREQLLDVVQGGESEAFDRAVDTHISNLRRKLEQDPKAPRYIKTVWGVGYRLETE